MLQMLLTVGATPMIWCASGVLLLVLGLALVSVRFARRDERESPQTASSRPRVLRHEGRGGVFTPGHATEGPGATTAHRWAMTPTDPPPLPLDNRRSPRPVVSTHKRAAAHRSTPHPSQQGSPTPMFKKFLAGLSAVALGLGLVALAAGPASAHTPSVTADCSAVNVSVPDYQATDPQTKTVTVWIDGTQVTSTTYATTFDQKYPFTTVAATHSYRVQVTAGDESQYSIDTGVVTVSNCLPDDTNKRITVCAWTGNPGSPYYQKTASVTDILTVTANGQYTEAIIPPFSYTKQGVAGTFPGQNWTTTGQVYFNSGCKSATVTPTTVTFTDAVCTASGQYGSGSGTISSVPAGVQYQASTVSANGPWQNVGQGTLPIEAGTTVFVRAIALDGYTLTGTSTWWHTVTHPVASSCVEAKEPVVNQSLCTGPGTSGQASYTLTPVTGVVYQVLQGQTWVTATGTTIITTFPTTVIGRAIAAPGYTIVGDVGPRTVVFTSPGNCIIEVVPAPVVFNDPICTGPGTSDTGSLVIPKAVTADGVTYAYYEVSVDGGPWEYAGPGPYDGTGIEKSVEVRATAEPGFTLTGTTWWSHTVVPAGECLVGTSVTTAPSFTDPVCTTTPGDSTSATYTLTAETGLVYETSTDGITYVTTDAGPHTVAAGTHLYVRAVALPGYALTGTTSWDHVFASPDCDVAVTPVAPTATDQSCSVTGDLGDGETEGLTARVAAQATVTGSITIPDTTGVQYYLDGEPVDAGPHSEAPGDYTVTASALDGYTLSDYPEAGWPLTVGSAEACGGLPTDPIVTPQATSLAIGCKAAGSYTLSNDLADPAAVLWTVNGSPVSQGTYQVSSARVVTVHADVNSPGYGFTTGTQQDWTFTFSDPTSCNLTTLAMTGSSPSGAMVIAYFLLIAGLGLIVIRTVRRRAHV